MRDTIMHMDSPVQLSSVLTPQATQQKSTLHLSTNSLAKVLFPEPGQGNAALIEAQQKLLMTAAATLDVLEKAGPVEEKVELPSYNHKILPIVNYQEQIAETIINNPVTIIQVRRQ